MFFVSNQFLSGVDEKRWCLHSSTIANSPYGSETYVKRGKCLLVNPGCNESFNKWIYFKPYVIVIRFLCVEVVAKIPKIGMMVEGLVPEIVMIKKSIVSMVIQRKGQKGRVSWDLIETILNTIVVYVESLN